jgi:general secretion pathway protein L
MSNCTAVPVSAAASGIGDGQIARRCDTDRVTSGAKFSIMDLFGYHLSGTAMTPLAVSGWRWWRASLANSVPVRLRRSWAKEPRCLIVQTRGTDVDIAIERGGLTNRLFAGPLADASATLATERRVWGPLLTAKLELRPSQYLSRTVELPRAARAQWGEMLLFDLEQTTPFQRDQVHSGWRAVDDGARVDDMEHVHHVVVKRSVTALCIEALAIHRIPVTAIEMLEIESDRAPIAIRSGLPSGSMLSQRLALAARLTATAAAVLAATYAGLAVWRQSQTLDQFEQDEARLSQEVVRVRKILSEGDATLAVARQVRLRKLETITTLQIWEEVTRILPGSAWLNELKIDDGTVTMDGSAASASELVGLFAKSPLFREIAFASPVTRDGQRGLERFQIKMRLSRVPTGTKPEVRAP